jgi:dihydroorotate dehydrogenase (NAD+) catalytic subunit
MAYDQSVIIGSLTLKNPVLTASGTFGYALEYDDFYDVATLGGICTKGLSLHPLAGNQPNGSRNGSRHVERDRLANVGVDAFAGTSFRAAFPRA